MEKISDASLRKYTTYKLEGKVECIYFPEDVKELEDLILKLDKEGTKYKILGNGSNMIISSKYDGVLIKLEKFDKLNIDGNMVTVGAGYMLPKLILECLNKGLSGLEFSFGIPATIGGAIYQNAGAYGEQMDNVIKSVMVLDNQGNIRVLNKDDLKLGYRDSIFKHKNFICLEAVLELKKDSYENIKQRMNTNLLNRKEKQPLEYPSAGSVFCNPPGYSAGKLIDDAGLKGFKIGDAMVSLKHANFIVNLGHATGEDVLELIEIIQEKVKDETGIFLEVEQEVLE